MRLIYRLLLALFLTFTLHAKNLYDLNTIQTIEIIFEESNWDALLDAQKQGDENYIMAKSITINGETLDSVGVKYKGNSTYNANQIKNPFHIELDTYINQDYDGYTDIKLSNVANDPSFVREVLSYQILGQYMDAPQSNYANVYINGQLIGLYSNSEAISKKFVKSHFGSKKNTFIKCNPPAGAGPNSTSLPNLQYLGKDSADYYDAYELQSEHGWNELINLCDTLTYNIAEIEKILDVDRALWMLAFDNALVNLDSYLGQFSQNYYLYRDKTGRFIPIVWDLNESFGRFSQTGTINLNTTSDKQKMSHLLHANDAEYPMVKMLLSIPMYKRMYLAHLKTIMLENFDNNSYFETATSLQTIIDTAVQADNNKFFTYSNFISNLTSDVSSGGRPGSGSSATPGIKSLMDGRNSYLMGLSDLTTTEPEISDITLSDPSPVINETVTISATILNANAAFLGYRTDNELPFVRLEMYDDGTHNDKIANDGIYSTPLTIDDQFVEYYIYAENNNAGKFSPQRAEHEFHTISATINDITVGHLVINEFMASNKTSIADQDNGFDDWIELYNSSNTSIDLSGYFLSDDSDSLTLWPFPSGTTIGAGGYLIIWADKEVEQTGLHANFKIASSSGSLFLVGAAKTILDEVSYSEQNSDIAYGRYPNGTGNFQTINATYEAENTIITTTTSHPKTASMLIYPNPAVDRFYINIDNPNSETENITIYNSIGKVIYQQPTSETILIDTSGWQNGLYIVEAGRIFNKVLIHK